LKVSFFYLNILKTLSPDALPGRLSRITRCSSFGGTLEAIGAENGGRGGSEANINF